MFKKFKENYLKPRSVLFGLTLVTPSLLTIFIIIIFPLLYTFFLSLGEVNANFGDYKFIGLENYISSFKDSSFLRSIYTTFKWVAGVVILELILGMCFALLLNTNIRGRNIYRTILLIPWALPPIVNGILWKQIYNQNFGALNGLLFQLKIIDDYTIAWLGTPVLAMISVIIAQVWKGTPFVTLMFLAGLQTIPEDLYDAAMVDGAGLIKRFRHITLPLLRPIILAMVLLNTVWSFNVFDVIYATTAGGPANSTQVIAYYVWHKTFMATNFSKGSALAFIVLLISLVFAYSYIKGLRRRAEL